MLCRKKVALKRFVDDIATEVIEAKLLTAVSTLFTPITAFEMPKDMVCQIAGEFEESQSLRGQLNKKLSILTKGSDTCKRFVSIRGLGKRTKHTFILELTKSVDLNNEQHASLQQNRAILSSSPCSSIELDSESIDEQSRSPSPDLLEQLAKDCMLWSMPPSKSSC